MTLSISSTLATDEDFCFEADELAATEDLLSRAYAPMVLSSGADERPSVRLVRRWLGPISFDELNVDFQVSFDAKPLGRICLCRVRSGRIEETFLDEVQDVVAAGDVAQFYPELAYSGRICQARYDLTMFDTALLNRVAAPPPGHEDRSVRLLSHRPVSALAQRQLSAAIDHLRTVVHATHVRDSPLVASTTAALLAAIVVSSFPTNAALEPTASERSAAQSTLLRRATAFIDVNAGRDIALSDIAAAVYLTPRALQYTFRRHLDTSPMEYLRTVRMERAHRQLVDADPTTTTVQTVAAQWGFAHTGRFSALYRRSYGRNPSDTLRS